MDGPKQAHMDVLVAGSGKEARRSLNAGLQLELLGYQLFHDLCGAATDGE